ncbi:FAD-dependent oxidoreductase [Desulfobacula sp.]|uniref:FAD-dependent oxidoreductase n=1 Tax=Desulfobacula sp. TaxID=2593537 RepID=UPI0026152157|nr:FAD-dependent oxidoreductase [Desulfobacula sp.]
MPPKFSREVDQPTITTSGMIQQKRTSPCEASCPAGNPIQKIHTLVQDNKFEEALTYLRSRNPLSGITGRICPHFCQYNCNRNHYDEGVSIRAIEKFVADQADRTQTRMPFRGEPTGKTLAVIGSGPAGMTCAYFCALLGHKVTVFESSPILGGMPRIGVPDFKLPKSIVDREIGHILQTGVTAVTNTTIGLDIPFADLRKDFDACLIAVGTWKEKRLDMNGADLVQPGVSFLKKVNFGLIKEIDGIVAVAGGGGVAYDCALAARRLGASDVHIFCVEDEQNSCAPAEDADLARKEGITVHHSCVISGITAKNSSVHQIEYCSISFFNFDECGRLSTCDSSSELKTMAVDMVISAIGLETDFTFLEQNSNLKFTPKQTLLVDPKTLQTDEEGVFGAGDAVTGPSSVAQAIGSGRQAALSINQYLSQKDENTAQERIVIKPDSTIVTQEIEDLFDSHIVEFNEILNVEYHEKKARALPLDTHLAGGNGENINKKDTVSESKRCLHCGHCISCGTCVEDCPGFVLDMRPSGPYVLYPEECWHCGCCRIACPTGAISYEFPLNMMV